MKKFRKYPYLIITLFATLLSIVVWFCVPKEYATFTVISDEYKEVDLAIGMNKLQARIRDKMGLANSGINDMEIYCKWIKTDVFVRYLSNVPLKDKDMTYGAWVARNSFLSSIVTPDTLDLIKENIIYKYSSKKQTLTVELTDADPYVAYTMLDSITAHLQDLITLSRHQQAEQMLNTAKAKYANLRDKYQAAEQRSADFADSHMRILTAKERNEQAALDKDRDALRIQYEKAQEEVIRHKSLLERSYVSFATVQNNKVPNQPTSSVWEYIIVIVSLALFLAKTGELFYRRYRRGLNINFGDVFSPWSLTIGIWAVNLILIAVQSDMIYPLQENFWYCVTIWITLSVSASYIAYLTFNSTDRSFSIADKTDWNFNMSVFNILWVISMILSPLYLYTVMKIVMMFDTQDMLYNIRYLAVYGGATNMVLNSVQGINMALFIVALWLYPRISIWRLLTIVVAYLTVEFAMMEKSGVLVMILSLLFVLYQRKIITVRGISISLLCTILLFFFINMSKELESKTSESMTFVDFFAIYITTPAVAFGYLTRDITDQFGINTFGQAFRYLNLLGFSFDTTERLQEFVFVPVPTNVYTIMQPFYEDFGRKGVAYFALIYGYMFGYIYAKFKSGSNVGRCIYTYFVEVIIIQFYNENLLQNLFISCGLIFWICCLTQSKVTLKLGR